MSSKSSTYAATLDMSEIDKLNELLERAIERTPKEREKALDRATERTYSEAHANASAFNKASTGALANTLEVGGTALSRTVSSPLREAWFLTVGSPNTGGPNEWLTGPAEDAVTDMLNELADSAGPW